MRFIGYTIFFILAFSLLSPISFGESTEEGKIYVVATLEIFSTFVEDIGGGRVKTDYIVPQGMDIHSYSLKYEDVKKIEEADLIVLASSEFFSLDSNILEKVEGKEILDFNNYNATLFPLGDMERNIHGYWLYPKNALGIAKAIEKKLEAVDPNNREYYQKNFEKFKENIDRALKSMEILSQEFDLKNKTALLAVPGTYYVVKALGMRIKGSIVKGPNRFLGGEEIERIKEEIKRGEIDVIVNARGLENSRAGEIAKQLSQETGVKVVYIEIFSAENYTSLLLKDSSILSSWSYVEHYGGSESNPTIYFVIMAILAGIIAIAFLEIYICRKELLK